MPDLKIEISADLSNATQGLKQVKDGVTNLKGALVAVETEFDKVNKQLIATQKYLPGNTARIAELQAKLKLLAPAQEAATKALQANTVATKQAEAASGGFTKGLSKAYSGLRTLANLIPGIGIGGLVALIAGPLIEAFNDLFQASNKAGESLSKTFAESAGSIGGNVARLQALVNIARDVTRSDESRKEALGALNKEYDSFNGKLTLANINTKYATDLIGKQTEALIRQAKIKGVQDLITEETKKQAEASTKSLQEQLSIMGQIKNALISTLGSASLGQADAVVSGLKARDKALKESKDNVLVYSQTLERLLGDEADAGTLFKEPKPATAKKIKDKIIKALKFKPDDLSKMFFDEATIKLQVPASVELEFKKSLRANPFESEGLENILGPAALTELQLKAKLAGMGITTALQDGLTVGVDGLRFPQLKALAESAEVQLADFNKNIEEISRNTAIDIFTSIGESIGSGDNLFGGFLRALGSGLKTLGAYMISVSAIVKGIKAAIKTLNPALLLIGGIALVAIGAALSKAKIPGFAGGVENFSGGLAVVGERGPELVRLPRGSDVIPNHALGSVGAAGSQVFIPEVRLRGSDLYVAFTRATQTINRNG